ncbi:hypothetical protein MAM1_0043c03031 [Mucor ambiguus]|uniref:Uncharacterized protein n=1 Tax=Mucor ambiguus TaxID=91626 RepID=A0A0C9M3J2_9FUNG|nr:hypothetical protein MAM1_0043c03031 [Mucor ambiguus]
MGELFDYFAEHASYDTFQIQEFLKIQNCPTKVSSDKNFKYFIESVCQSKSKQAKYPKAKAFANKIRDDKFDVLKQVEFIEYWRLKEQVVTRAKLRCSEIGYGQVFGVANPSPIQVNSSDAQANPSDVQANPSDAQANPSQICSLNSSQDDPDYESKESTPSSTSSNDGETGSRKYYLVHDGDSYEYKLKDDASRWIVDNYDVSDAFFNYREQSKTKAEDLEELDTHEQLSLDGIMLIDKDFMQTDVVDYQHIEAILDDIDNHIHFKQPTLPSTKKLFLSRFAEDMARRKINKTKIFADINSYKQENGPDANILCTTLENLVNTYTADYTNDKANEATLVRDSIDNILKPYFPNSLLTRSVGADRMIRDSSDRFTRLDPSLACSGKRADFSVVSLKSCHALLSLEAKSNRTKNVDEMVKLCKEMKDTIKAIHKEKRGNVAVCGILMRDVSSQVYVMDHEFDGLYRVVLLGKFDLPRDCYGMQNLVSIISVFEKLKTIVHSSATTLRAKPAPRLRIPEDIVSMHTPTFIQVAKRILDKNDPRVKNAHRKLCF